MTGVVSPVGVHGTISFELFDEYGNLKEAREFPNLVTQVGDQYYAERAAGVAGAPALVTGMQLGTGTTAVAKTGAGAAIVTLAPSTLVAISPTTPVSSLSGSSRRLTYSCSFGAGVGTATLQEIALVNQSVGTQTVAPASATIARALIPGGQVKGAGDTLNVTWYHDFLGA